MLLCSNEKFLHIILQQEEATLKPQYHTLQDPLQHKIVVLGFFTVNFVSKAGN
jgi:hypothetical protein